MPQDSHHIISNMEHEADLWEWCWCEFKHDLFEGPMKGIYRRFNRKIRTIVNQAIVIDWYLTFQLLGRCNGCGNYFGSSADAIEERGNISRRRIINHHLPTRFRLSLSFPCGSSNYNRLWLLFPINKPTRPSPSTLLCWRDTLRPWTP